MNLREIREIENEFTSFATTKTSNLTPWQIQKCREKVETFFTQVAKVSRTNLVPGIVTTLRKNGICSGPYVVHCTENQIFRLAEVAANNGIKFSGEIPQMPEWENNRRCLDTFLRAYMDVTGCWDQEAADAEKHLSETFHVTRRTMILLSYVFKRNGLNEAVDVNPLFLELKADNERREKFIQEARESGCFDIQENLMRISESAAKLLGK